MEDSLYSSLIIFSICLSDVLSFMILIFRIYKHTTIDD